MSQAGEKESETFTTIPTKENYPRKGNRDQNEHSTLLPNEWLHLYATKMQSISFSQLAVL